jgi:hypothetical protein
MGNTVDGETSRRFILSAEAGSFLASKPVSFGEREGTTSA